MGIWPYIKAKKVILIKLFFLFAISFLFISRTLNNIDPYPNGDGAEYIMTTEAIYNHFTPDIRNTDIKSFKENYYQKDKWPVNFSMEYFNRLEAFLTQKSVFLQQDGGVYTDKFEKNYGYHFFFYSILNVPGRYIAEKMHGNPLIAFQVTNAIFVIIVCFILLFITPFSLWNTILTMLSFCFSSLYWYLGWPHPEVYTICLVTLSFWFFFQERYYLAILLMALAGMQNQPLIIMLLFMAIKTVIVKGFNLKNIFKIGISSILFVWPSLFYLLHFNTTNLIKDAGFLSTEYITYTRVLGFYIDLNQGVILAIPLVLFLYVFFMMRKVFFLFTRKEKFDFNYLLPFFLIVMACIVSTMGNWNHGQAVINRYASWFSAIILIHVLFISNQFKQINSITLLNYIFLTQVFTTLYHQQFNHWDWGQNSHKPIAKWMLDKHPNLYNPDPIIFITRTTHNYDYSPGVSPVFYIKDYNTINKIALYNGGFDSLLQYGFSKEEIYRIIPKLHFINNWAYLNKGEFVCTKSGSEVYNIKRAKKIKSFEQSIRSHPEWLQQIEIKAKGWGISTDEAIKRDAEYLMTLEEKEN